MPCANGSLLTKIWNKDFREQEKGVLRQERKEEV
jgi:hypothetical protein